MDALRAAHRAQDDFEHQRRLKLPGFRGVSGGGDRCEVRIGRLCYWNNNRDPAPPPEPRGVAVARDTLLARLAAAAAADSADEWTVGQRVRYLAEGNRVDEAARVAEACRARAAWCLALRGLAYHMRSEHARAAAVYDSALAAMPEYERCAWTNVRWWLDGDAARDYKRLPCGPERDAWEARFWLAARPLLSLDANDLRTELLARRTMSRVREQGTTEYDMAWDEDFAELEARYGWPVAWSVRVEYGSFGTDNRSVVGHEATPSYAFVPKTRALAAPTLSDSADWALGASLASTRYAPRYANTSFDALPHQLARFRRGDSTLVVAAWDAARDAAWRRDTLPTAFDPVRGVSPASALALADSAGHLTVVRGDSASAGAIVTTVPNGRPLLASLELLDARRGRAKRARGSLAPLAADAITSDLLLLSDTPPAGERVEQFVRGRALGTRTIAAGARVGLYWETYAPLDSAASVDVSVQATRIDAGFLDRVGRALRLSDDPQSPVAVRFSDPARPGAQVAGRSLALTWPANATGTYRLEVRVQAGDVVGVAATTVRVEKR